AVVCLKRSPLAWTARLRREGLRAACGLIVIALVYAICYIPILRVNGYNFGAMFGNVSHQQERLVRMRLNPNSFRQRYVSRCWQWPTLLRPVWMQFNREPSVAS